MRMTYDRLSMDELRGSTQADYLIALDGHFQLLVDERAVYDEPGFPVVELAWSLHNWLRNHPHVDFEFDSMSYEEVGSLFIRKIDSGWEVGSIFASEVAPAMVRWDDVEQACRAFIAAVEADLSQLGIDPAAVIGR